MSHQNRIEEILRHVRGPTVLDLGAIQHDVERTRNKWWLHRHLLAHPDTEHVIGVDILEEAVAALNAEGYEMVCADVETMDLDVRADTIVAGELIEHLANPGAMIARLEDHLAPSGRVVLSTPNPWAIVHLRRWLQRSPQINDEHVTWFGPVVLEQLFERYGFEITHLRAVGPDHGGLTAWAKRLGYDTFGGTAWVCVAQRNDGG